VTIDRCTSFEALWPRLLGATTEKTDGFDIILEFIESIGTRYASYEVYSDRDDQPKGLVLNNLPTKYCANYNDNAQYEFDPVVLAYKTKLLPFRIGSSVEIKELRGLDRYIFAEARGYGIGEALCVPLHGVGSQFAMFAVTGHDDFGMRVDPGTTFYNSVVAFAPYVQAYWASRQEQAIKLPRSAALSEPEKICLAWTQHGKTSWEVGQIIGRSQSTVDHHLTRAMHKLNTVNKAHAVATALRLGLI